MRMVVLALALPAMAVDTADTRLLSEPAVSAERIAFAYANDLWTAKPDGSGVARLTSHAGVESGPRFSPDGAWIAFTGRYEGNTDVYIVSAAGGVPRRLTYHPGNDTALGFTPDSKSVLFASPREVYTTRYQQLFTVPVEGGFPTKLPIPNASKAAISADGKTVAYLPLYEAFNQWKNYRGGTTARLLLFDTRTHDVVQVPQPEGRCNDTDPMWMDGVLFFRSDRDGEFNLYRYEPATKAVSRVTRHEDFPVLTASAGAGSLVYEQAGALHRLDPKSGTATRLKIGVATDLVEHRPRWAKGTKWVRGGHISPTGARVALEFRGEIVTLPREKGDERNLTQTPGAHEQSPSWSPDGRQVAYFSDQSGEYQLVIAPQDGKGTRRSLPLPGAGFYSDIRWSPDAKKLSYTDNSRAIWMLDVASGLSTKISADKIYGPNGLEALDHAWSPDSQWLAFTRNNEVFFNRIFLYSLATKQEIAVTDGLSDARRPVWDASGKYLFFKASTDAGPVVDWFSQANNDMAASESLYLAVLAKGVVSPLAKESDEEKPKEDKPAETAKPDAAKGASKAGDKPAEKKEAPVKVVVDADGLSLRILALPAKAGRYEDLTAGPAGQIFYRRASAESGRAPGGSDAALIRYDLGKRKEDTLLEKADGFQLSADGKRALVRVKESWSLVDIADKLDLAKFKLDVDKIQVRVEPLAEWTQIYDEAWRVNRDYFYDPGMHGADWKALKVKYAAFLPHLATRNDLQRVMTWLHSELAVGHHRQSPGDTPWELENVPGGLLGADYAVEHGRYRFKKVFGGLNWNPELRSPLTEPGVDVKAGEYLLAVEGRDLKFPDEIYARFERTAGKSIEITVGPGPDGTGSRIVKVVPIENEANLRNRDWVEGNLAKVTAATNGRVAYVYVPNTASPGHTYFKRYFFPQSNREALIIDERHNGGGQIADYYIDLMRRPRLSFWAFRYGADLKTPIAGIHGPKVMLADETAGSGGDMLPWMFQQLKLGKVVGKRTWGGLVGVLGFPTLMDGAVMTAPNLAIWTEDGFIVENVGVAPDVEVEQTPKDVIAGRDPQLEKAIEIALAELKASPVVTPKRPPFPVRVRKP